MWKYRYGKRENPRRSNRKEGQIGLVISMFFLLMALVIGIYILYLFSIVQVGSMVEDSLVASGLACALVDVETLGKTGEIRIESPKQCYDRFIFHLKENLKLDDEGNSSYHALSMGPVTLLDFRIYNVQDTVVTEYVFDGNGNLLRQLDGSLGNMYTPDGKEIQSATVFAKIGFYVKGIHSSVVYGTKKQTVDIKENP